MVELLELVLKWLQWPLEKAAKQIQTLPDDLRFTWGNTRRVAVIAAFITFYGIGILAVELLLTSLLGFALEIPEIVHSVLILLGFFMLPILICLEIRKDAQKAKEELEGKLGEAIAMSNTAFQTIPNLLPQLLPYATPALIAVFKNALYEARTQEPLLGILAALSPSNEQIKAELMERLHQLGKELRFSEDFHWLSETQRNTLMEVLSLDLKDKPWGPLFMTFAVQLQLAPWAKAADRPARYVFIRDYEEISCFHNDPDDAVAEFQSWINRDLEAILTLVNGKLFSIMYRDIGAWEESSYYESNLALLGRARTSGTKLRRLFVYESEWLKKGHRYFDCLAAAAEWHRKLDYECAFVQRGSDLDAALKPCAEVDDDNFLASCLINSTRILMYREISPSPARRTAHHAATRRAPPGSVNRYVYRCNAEAPAVHRYESVFSNLFTRPDAKSPQQLLEIIEKEEPGWHALRIVKIAKSFEDVPEPVEVRRNVVDTSGISPERLVQAVDIAVGIQQSPSTNGDQPITGETS
jgi:hypothetical protein